MIDKLKQIEDKMLLELLEKPDEWKTLLVDYHPPIVERCWAQVGNYRILLHFIHKCEKKDALFHPHPWPSAMHVLTGKYEMGLGFGPGLEEPPNMCTIELENGGAYYDMTHIDGWHYVRPVDGVCATVMLIGKPWGREEIKSDEPLKGMDFSRKIIMLDWFKNYYRAKIQGKKIIENKKIGKGDWIKLNDKIMSPNEKKGLEAFFEKRGFVIGNDMGIIDVRFGNDRTKVDMKNVILLDPKDKPIIEPNKNSTTDWDKKEIDDMDPANWEDDDKDNI